jgi:hypothetical protein
MSEAGERLLAEIGRAFNKRMKTDRKLLQLAGKIPKSADYITAGDYAVRTGELLSKSIIENVENLPTISRELAGEILPPLLEYDYQLAAEAARKVQENLNSEAGLGVEAVVADLDTNRINGLVDKVSSYENTADSLWVLQEPLINYSQAVTDQTLRKNAEVSAKMGVERYIIRTTESRETKTRKPRKGRKKGAPYVVPCEWCSAQAGRYEYRGNGSNIPHSVYQRHSGCRCKLTFVNGKNRQNVWGHSETWTEEDADQTKKAARTRMTKAEKQAAEQRRQIAEARLRGDVGFLSVDPLLLKRCDPDLLDAVTDRLAELEKRFNIVHRSKTPMLNYDGARRNAIAYVARNRLDSSRQDMYFCKMFRSAEELMEQERLAVSVGFSMPIDVNDIYQLQTYTVAHEYGHMVHNYLYHQYVLANGGTGFAFGNSMDAFMFRIKKEIQEIALSQNPGMTLSDFIEKTSEYGRSNSYEFFAEAFANSQGTTPNEIGRAMRVFLERQGF